jgi:CelD/BcsL family acetyltransferase involved in cellulose biosynthesis
MQEPGSVCPVVHLAGGVDAWRRQLSAGLRRNLRRYGERLVADSGARFVTVEGENDLSPALNALMRLHSSRWHERYAPGVFANPRVRRFHFAVAPILLRRGMLRLHVIAVGCDIIAAQYVLIRGRRAYSYVGGFDPSWGRYSPGALLMAYAIERAIEDGCETFDLLRGREAYKYEWGAVDERSLTFRRDAVRA